MAVSPVASRPVRADAKRNHDRIVAAGRTVFAEMGDEARIEDIARTAGVGVGTVYRHFATKEALMVELLTEKFSVMAGHMREARDSEGDPWELYARALRRNVETMAEDAAVRFAIQRALSPEDFDHSEVKAALVEATEVVIARGQASGQIRADLTVEDIPLVMCGVCASIDRAPGRPRDWRRHLEIVLDGMRA